MNLLHLPQILNNDISQFSIICSSGRKCCKSWTGNIITALIIINTQYSCQHELKSQMHFLLIMVKIQIFSTMSFSRSLFKNTPLVQRTDISNLNHQNTLLPYKFVTIYQIRFSRTKYHFAARNMIHAIILNIITKNFSNVYSLEQ